MEQSLAASQNLESSGKLRESTFGVQSLADTLEAAFGPESTEAADKTAKSRNSLADNDKGISTCSVPKPKRRLSNFVASMSLASITVDAPSPIPTSALPGTPTSVSLHSLKLSDEESALDDVTSQVITSSGEEEYEVEGELPQAALSSFPQLVMPSIQMPTRRPFTTKGKTMGKLKVLVAGENGEQLLIFKSTCLTGRVSKRKY